LSLRSSFLLVVGLLLVAAAIWLWDQTARADDPVFTEQFLNDPEVIAHGKELFVAECRHCHGTSSYPGKAPKLKPKRLTADDVYLRMTYGWRTMPAWEDVLSQDERMAVTAYVKSKHFSP
jgi:mono/diheme cytochrome c family protein